MSLSVPLRRAARTAVCCLALAGSAVVASAQQAAPLKVAVIDVQRLLTDSAEGKSTMDRLKALGETKKQDIESRQAEITDMRNRLTEGRLSLSEERQAEMEKELQAKLVDLRRVQEDANRELEQEQDKALGGIEAKVIPLIAKIAEEQGYTMVFNKFQSGLLYATDSIDITAEVLQRFDAESSGGN
ncbi:MAG: OmpH family outer membrane protein [Thermoanaerobaculia bacterium]